MGILNVTPDSFYEKSRTFSEQEIRQRTLQMLKEGADIIDVGGYSTRPGASDISEEEETERVCRGLKVVREISDSVILSVDTFRSSVAREAVSNYGCDIINDISFARADTNMLDTVARLRVPYILTHNSDTTRSLGTLNDYTANAVVEMSRILNKIALLGINDVIIDPGIGFSKTLEENYRLLADLQIFEVFRRPVLVGISRKSLITRLLGIEAADSLAATSALNAIALTKGASILRVHDVAQAKQCVALYEATVTKNALNQPLS